MLSQSLRMTLSPKIHFVLFLLGAALLATACTTTDSGPVAITKVNPYHLTEAQLVKTEDEMIKFEHRRHIYGNVDAADLREHKGYYYTVFWNSKNKAPATVRFDYRQGATGPEIHTKEIQVSDPKRRNATRFEIVGTEYQKLGRVTQWKASIIENGTVVAEYKSFLWK